MLTLPIRESIPVTPRANVVRLDLQGHPFSYHPGQAAYLHPAEEAKRRPYSIASSPEQTATSGLLEFLIQTDTAGISGVPQERLRKGTLVVVDGPMGSFQFPDHPRETHFLFIAGGTGIAPLRSMIWHVLLAERSGDVGLIYSVRSPDEFAYLNEFEQLAGLGRIAFHHTVTRGAGEGWAGRQGRVDAAFLKQLVRPAKTLCFVCGPPALVGEMPTVLKDLGVGADQIVVERWR